MSGNGGSDRSPQGNYAHKQITAWWHEAEDAIHAEQVPRARRFLRWILAVCPDDEEAWLEMAHLAPNLTEELAYLWKAYRFHPHSIRTQVALREARFRQLESAVNELTPRSAGRSCLPNIRQNGHKNGASQNGHHPPEDRAAQKAGRPGFRVFRRRL
jgi:hypothetical protein